MIKSIYHQSTIHSSLLHLVIDSAVINDRFLDHVLGVLLDSELFDPQYKDYVQRGSLFCDSGDYFWIPFVDG